MRHTRPRRVAGYRWYSWETGAVDLLALARDAVQGLPVAVPAVVPPWLDGFPTEIPNARPVDLAKLDARARAAVLDFMSDRGTDAP